MARVLVTGASGLVGTEVVAQLVRAGHDVLAASREPNRHLWHPDVQPVHYEAGKPLPRGLDAIINLAGASIGGKRWSRTYKQELVHSRLQAVRDAIAASPKALIQASAIGFYGMDPQGTCPEDRGPGDDFLADLCRRWEEEAAQNSGRTAVFRFGHVLSDGKEGILGRLVPLYKARLGGRIGSGEQGLPWVHVKDVARALVWAMDNETVQGTFNLAAPEAVTQRTFNDALADALGVRAPWWIPGAAMRVAVGELGPYLVGGQTTPADKLQAAGFTFQHPTLRGALRDLFPDDA